jgi:hypothetical protein
VELKGADIADLLEPVDIGASRSQNSCGKVMVAVRGGNHT